ncbi:hypothetical protein VTI74DRAFT_6827 [Chaetomium olivicolor]
MPPFVLWKDRQRAIGEIMTDTDKNNGELICMQYSKFRRRWKANDFTLRTWFRVIPEAIQYLVDVETGVSGARENAVDSQNTLNTQSTLAAQRANRAHVLKIRLRCLA